MWGGKRPYLAPIFFSINILIRKPFFAKSPASVHLRPIFRVLGGA